MQRVILDKLKIELGLAIESERQVVYILVEIRKFLEQEPSNQFEALKMYCDWALHHELGHNKYLKNIFQTLDEGIGCGLTDVEMEERLKAHGVLSMVPLRKELGRFIENYGLPPVLTKYDSCWRKFLKNYLEVITDCPITYTKQDYRPIHFKKANLRLMELSIEEQGQCDLPDQVLWVWELELIDGTQRHVGVTYVGEQD